MTPLLRSDPLLDKVFRELSPLLVEDSLHSGKVSPDIAREVVLRGRQLLLDMLDEDPAEHLVRSLSIVKGVPTKPLIVRSARMPGMPNLPRGLPFEYLDSKVASFRDKVPTMGCLVDLERSYGVDLASRMISQTVREVQGQAEQEFYKATDWQYSSELEVFPEPLHTHSTTFTNFTARGVIGMGGCDLAALDRIRIPPMLIETTPRLTPEDFAQESRANDASWIRLSEVFPNRITEKLSPASLERFAYVLRPTVWQQLLDEGETPYDSAFLDSAHSKTC